MNSFFQQFPRSATGIVQYRFTLLIFYIQLCALFQQQIYNCHVSSACCKENRSFPFLILLVDIDILCQQCFDCHMIATTSSIMQRGIAEHIRRIGICSFFKEITCRLTITEVFNGEMQNFHAFVHHMGFQVNAGGNQKISHCVFP